MTTPTQGPKSLDDLYASDTPDPIEASPAQATGETPAQPSAAAAPSAEAPAAQAASGQPPGPTSEPKPEGTVAALQDERRKRQQRDKEIADLRREFDELKRQTQGTGEKKGDEMPDPIVDHKAFAEYIDKRNFVKLVDASRADMIDEVGEDQFLAAEAAFIDASKADPKLAERLLNSRDPGKYAYTQGKKILESREAPADADLALFEKIKAKLEQDYDLVPKTKAAPAQGQQPAAHAPSRPALPTSLAGVQSAAPRSTGSKAAPARRSLDDLYGS